VFGLVGIAYAPLLTWSLPGRPEIEGDRGQSPDASPSEPASFGEICRTLAAERWFWLLAMINVLVGISNWVVYAWLPTYLRERFTLGLGMAGISATAYVQVASFVGTLAGGVWADGWSRRQPRARAWVPAVGYLLAGPFLFAAATADLLPLAIVGLIVFGLGRGMFDANHMPLVRKLVPARASATAYGVLNFVSCMAGGVMIYIGGALKDAQLDLARVFQAAAVGLFVAGALLALLGAGSATNAEDGG
jgi:sugar phosphate permease